jgi:hypothetical protein
MTASATKAIALCHLTHRLRNAGDSAGKEDNGQWRSFKTQNQIDDIMRAKLTNSLVDGFSTAIFLGALAGAAAPVAAAFSPEIFTASLSTRAGGMTLDSFAAGSLPERSLFPERVSLTGTFSGDVSEGAVSWAEALAVIQEQ